MRKFCLALFSFLFVYSSSHSQETISKITKNYFRSDPFANEFSSFVTHLLNDPTLTGKILEKKTDTSLFYFSGIYKNHAPFFFKPKRVEIILTEVPIELDSLQTDTIYSYQLFAYSDDTQKSSQELKKEFEKIYKRFKGGFSKNTFTASEVENKSNGATYNFFDPFHAVAPFALTWFGPDGNKEICLVLTIRMETYGNRAILPAPFYTPQ